MRTASKNPGELLKTLRPGVFATIAKTKPSGALQARLQTNGAITFCWRFSKGAASSRISLGVYDPKAKPKSLTPSANGYSIDAAIRAAEDKAVKHYAHKSEGGYHAILASEQVAGRAALAASEAAKPLTMEKLLTDYCDHLESIGRTAHRDARSIFKLHVFEPRPEVAGKPAADVTIDDITDMMRRLLELKKGRTSNKLRSYIRAAYQMAKGSRTKPSIPVHFKAYQITSNPAADTEPDESQNKPDKNPLPEADMRAYWKAIKSLPGIKGAALRLHLLTGAQRIEQLVRLETAAIKESTILLHDSKGRPGKAPRAHWLPLTGPAATALRACKPQGTFALSTDGGKTQLAATTLSRWAVDAASAIPGFATKRLRSGVETLLASARVSSDTRGRLQSHGISGVQARHYDAHDYLEEKREALETLYRHLTGPEASNVRPFKKRA